MVTAGTGPPSLSTSDIDQIRESLAAGRKPKVVFTDAAGQIAGQVGQVVELTDPAGSDEWVVVRFGRDELPFSPADLAVAPKVPARRGPAKSEPEPVAPPFMIGDPPSVPSPREEPVVSTSTVESGVTVKQPAESAPGSDAATDSVPAAKKAVKAVKPKAPAGLTVTVAYTEGEWTVAATQGAKTLAKPYVIKASEALKMVALLDVPGVQEAVEHIIAAERSEAEHQAERLRAELAEIEARLAELRDPH